MTETQNLLAEYLERGSEAAFRDLVSRYVDLVYSAALRLVGGDTHLAEDVTQTVFTDLALKARAFSSEVMLGGWLHQHTCFVAANTLRGERRRQARERQAVEMHALQDHSDAPFSRVAPVLDAAINELAEPDRTAILLRFFEQHDFRKIGQTLGSTEDAARMRVNRALEKLALLLKRRGITSTSAALAVALSAHALQGAPAGLAAAAASAALAGTAASSATAIAATKTLAMTTLQKALVTTTVAVVAATGIYEARQASRWRADLETVQQQQAPLVDQLQQLQQQRDAATNRLAAMAEELQRLGRNESELLKLRGEVGTLRQQAAELGQLRQENQKLQAQLAAQSEANGVPAEDQFILRNTHAVDAMSTLITAVKSYTTNHGGQFPSNFEQLTASGALTTTNFPGQLSLNDFEFYKEPFTHPRGGKDLLSLRNPIPKPSGGAVIVTGGIDEQGIFHTSTWPVSP